MRVADLPQDVSAMPHGVWFIEPLFLRQALLRAAQADDLPVAAQPARGSPVRRSGSVALLKISGVITPARTIFGAIFGGEITHDEIRQQLDEAAGDEQVDAVVMVIDSPGGSAMGMQRLAEDVRSAAAAKPLIAYTESTMTSAAYFIGAQAARLYVSPEGVLGSIGTIIPFYDWSKFYETAGVKPDPIVSGPMKSAMMQGTSLSDKQREMYQTLVDDVAGVFKTAVARGRQMDAATLDKLGDARLLVGQRAVDAGLADGVMTLNALLGRLKSGALQAELAGGVRQDIRRPGPREEIDMPDKPKAPEAAADNSPPTTETKPATAKIPVQPAAGAELAEETLRRRVMAITPEGLRNTAEGLLLTGKSFDEIRGELLKAYAEQAPGVGTPPTDPSQRKDKPKDDANVLNAEEQAVVSGVLGG